MTVSNKYEIQPDSAEKSICYHKYSEAATIGVLLKKARKAQHKFFPVNIEKFLRIPILTNLPKGDNN